MLRASQLLRHQSPLRLPVAAAVPRRVPLGGCLPAARAAGASRGHFST
eukprot:SAG22_NODE_9046_length_613_cov_0.900778_1_plen_47_part_01